MDEFKKAEVVCNFLKKLKGEDVISTTEECFITNGETVLPVNPRTYTGYEQRFYARIAGGEAVITRIEG